MKLKILLVLGIIFLITTNVSASNIPIKKSPIKQSSGNTLYVGGSGPGNYSSIQDAIDDAVFNDTVFVYDDSAPYFENILIDKSINLIGEDKQTTIIDGSCVEKNVISITADRVNICCVTIQKSSNVSTGYVSGIYIKSNHNTITNNNIYYHHPSHKGFFGIELIGDYNNIIGTNISYNECGLCINGSNNTIKNNNISNNIFGLSSIITCNNNYIYHNNFVKNIEGTAYDWGKNIWDDGKYGNYWSDYEERYPNAKPKLFKPWMWDNPYQIGIYSKDNCPLVKQWPKTTSKTITNIKINFNSFLYLFFERFPNLFPVLQ